MAEFVQRRVENQIPELQQLERVGLLTGKEARAVIRKVTALEYKLKRRTAEKEDYLQYIQYEINYLELLKKRRQRIGYAFKKEEIEYVILQRIHELFRRATNRWKEDLQLWLSHVAFCKKWNCKNQQSRIFSSLLAVHPDKPALWIMAAKWEFEDQLSSESARQLFLRALRFHPDSAKLYQEYFRMELMNVEKQRIEREDLGQTLTDIGEASYSDEILDGGLVRVVYKSAVQKIKGAEFQLSLLSIAKKFNFTGDLQKAILSDLQALHAEDPLTWDFLARQELSAKPLPSAEYTSKQTKAQDLARLEEQSSRVYETALGSLQTESMWELYVSFCQERYRRQTNSKELKQQRQDRLLSTLQKAHDAGLLPQARYHDWVSLLMALEQGQMAAEVLAAATDRFPGSVDMWKKRLETLMTLKSENVEQVFEKALTLVKMQDSLPLWTLMVGWSEKERDEEATKSLYQKLVLNPVTTRTMKVKYLDWAYRTQGYNRARKVFSCLQENRPFSEDFFTRMIDIEKDQEKSKMANLREYYERALREFGATQPDLWLSYIREELSHGEGKPENCGAIHWRAMKVLQGADVEVFVSRYTLLQSGHL
ncbi:U3 small nucleolar RNA-associated protein 6 homolog [Bufo bufo]|uniref:U3 small nucleolar RNA-associated protein 6 homolog n=1 Tax=Bufo bufo TaxID=8384 RepID=UPI001ABEA667|nr:U3 small nucleolar RNA-associated protein 6 homolog [Bufo bufo]